MACVFVEVEEESVVTWALLGVDRYRFIDTIDAFYITVAIVYASCHHELDRYRCVLSILGGIIYVTLLTIEVQLTSTSARHTA